MEHQFSFFSLVVLTCFNLISSVPSHVFAAVEDGEGKPVLDENGEERRGVEVRPPLVRAVAGRFRRWNAESHARWMCFHVENDASFRKPHFTPTSPPLHQRGRVRPKKNVNKNPTACGEGPPRPDSRGSSPWTIDVSMCSSVQQSTSTPGANKVGGRCGAQLMWVEEHS